jgi:hypothetical protein
MILAHLNNKNVGNNNFYCHGLIDFLLYIILRVFPAIPIQFMKLPE